MLFLAWMLAWILGACGVLGLAVCVFPLLVRTNYLDRPVARLAAALPVASAMLVFLGSIHSSGGSPSDAALNAGKVLVSGWLFLHLAGGLEQASAGRAKPVVQWFFYFCFRAVPLERNRLGDIVYAVKSRWRSGQVTGWARLRLLSRGFMAAMVELLHLHGDFVRVVSSRGVWPAKSDWMLSRRRIYSTWLGDIALFMMCLFPALLAWRQALPMWMLEAFSYYGVSLP